ncbi:sensor histidine kinase [Clostridioides difficile]
MFLYNPEVKNFISKYIILMLMVIFISIGFSIININTAKNMIVKNNQAIIGTLVNKYPKLESDIVDIITQGKSMENVEFGEKILSKYNYDKTIKISSEPLTSKLLSNTIKINIILVCIIFMLIFMLMLKYFKAMYNDLSDMTKYVYYSSEGKEFDMKNRNQEGQIGLLKTELLKMTTILSEKVELLNSEKIFLNNTISDISHQLKTPMTSLIILSDLLYNDVPYEVKIDFLDKIKNQLNRMDWLIKSMLKLSKVEAKVIKFKKEKIKFSELIHKAMQPMKIPMEIKNQKLNIEGNGDVFYVGDVDWSVEALVNIIKNCIEHTPEFGNINIIYKENPIFSELIIKDDGEGIDKKDIPHIFKRFYRGKSSTKEDSVGIGLAMAKSIIESQNGDIYVNSEKGKGTEFHIAFHKIYDDNSD